MKPPKEHEAWRHQADIAPGTPAELRRGIHPLRMGNEILPFRAIQ
jgi:hypothetical protein